MKERGAPLERFRRVVEAMSHPVVITDLKRTVRSLEEEVSRLRREREERSSTKRR